MTSEHDILNTLRETMKRAACDGNVRWSDISPSSAVRDLGFDSLSMLDLIYEIQQEFGVEFDAEEMADVRTVGDLILFLQRKLA